MTRNRMRSLPVVLLVVVLLLGACDWSQSRFGSGRSGASPDTALSPANVAQLTLRWHQVAGRSGRFWTPGGFVVTGGSVFAPVAGTSPTGIEALDAATGDGRWITPTPMGDASVDASANGFVFTHGNDLEVFDAATGALRWSVSGDTYGTDGSTVVGDTV
jgi:outer membrane protein assembly factor BamB